jgi:hypothetical protein
MQSVSMCLLDWARQAALQIYRWLPDRYIVLVGDSAFAAIEFLAAVRNYVCVITRLRLDANLFDFPPHKRKGGNSRRVIRRSSAIPANRFLASTSAVRIAPAPILTGETEADFFNDPRPFIEGGDTLGKDILVGFHPWLPAPPASPGCSATLVPKATGRPLNSAWH